MTKHNLRIQALIEVEKAKIQMYMTLGFNGSWYKKELEECIARMENLAELFE
mgnify:CR=1 FL=1